MSTYQVIKMNQIKPNQYQPRTTFADDSIEELAQSIKENGLLQPITVRECEDGYQLIAGERRYRACLKLNRDTIEAIVIKAGEVQSATLALIENIQRENLSPIDEANGYLQMIRLTGLTQSQLGQKLGKKQSTIANKIRLLNLDLELQQAISDKVITERHGRALLSLDEKQQKEVLKKIIAKEMNVSQTEQYVSEHYLQEKKKKTQVKCFSLSAKIIINSIKETYKKVKEISKDVQMTESEDDQNYIITFTIKK
ncbi:MAG: ParB/RepB/Spo0J family partition protein [Erysipelotrichaceae bacterium]